MSKALEKGDYVLATKYSDGDPQDQWSIGFYDHFEPNRERHYVVDTDGKQFRGNGFRRAQKISEARGRFMLTHAKSIEMSGRSVWHFIKQKICVGDFLTEPVEKLMGKEPSHA